MAGRTDRVKARELEDRFQSIIFEVAVCQEWLETLKARASTVLTRGKHNRVFQQDFLHERLEIVDAGRSLDEASRSLECFNSMVKRRGG